MSHSVCASWLNADTVLYPSYSECGAGVFWSGFIWCNHVFIFPGPMCVCTHTWVCLTITAPYTHVCLQSPDLCSTCLEMSTKLPQLGSHKRAKFEDETAVSTKIGYKTGVVPTLMSPSRLLSLDLVHPELVIGKDHIAVVHHCMQAETSLWKGFGSRKCFNVGGSIWDDGWHLHCEQGSRWDNQFDKNASVSLAITSFKDIWIQQYNQSH